MMAVLGGVIVMAAAMLLYLASPHQQLARRPVSAGILAWTGSAGIALGLGFILQWAGPVAAVFIAMTLAMLVWTIVPMAFAWARSALGASASENGQ